MKLKLMAAGCLLALFANAYAENLHVPYQGKKPETTQIAPGIKANYAGYCEIEIINQSFEDVRVNGFFDDGLPLLPFTIYRGDLPYYIPLFYDGYCHYGMNLYIDSYYGYNLYSGYTPRETTVRVFSYLKENKPQVDLIKH